MVQVNWTYQAKKDLKGIADFIAKDSKLYGKRMVLKLKNRTNVLKTQPYIGKMVLEFEDQSIRELVEGSYRIVYRIVTKQRIDIITIHHAARDLHGRNLY